MDKIENPKVQIEGMNWFNKFSKFGFVFRQNYANIFDIIFLRLLFLHNLL